MITLMFVKRWLILSNMHSRLVRKRLKNGGFIYD